MGFVIFLFIYFSIVNCKNLNNTVNPMEESHKSVLGVSEGKSDLPISSRLALSKSSGLVIGKNSVVPRKGADYNSSKEVISLSETNNGLPVKSDTLKNEPVVSNVKPSQKQSKTASTNSVNDVNLSLNKTTTNANDTTTHKKPQILSYEALANASQIDQGLRMQKDNLSSKTTISDQLNSPIESKPASEKIHPMQSSRHPDMIMPVVITILVVPMFAVLGYMVLRRGQEAWKNRHYKRMDFLLDGMYND